MSLFSTVTVMIKPHVYANHDHSSAQVIYAMDCGRGRGNVTLKKSKDRPSILSQEDVNEPVNFTTSSSINWRMTYIGTCRQSRQGGTLVLVREKFRKSSE